MLGWGGSRSNVATGAANSQQISIAPVSDSN